VDTVPSGAITLTQDIGAVAGGMGNAYTTIADDTDIIFYNPAGLAGLNRTELSVMHQTGRADDEFGAFAFCYPSNMGTFAFSSILYNDAGIQQDYIGILSCGRNISKGLDAGLNIKTINSNLLEDESAAQGMCLDFGMIYSIPSLEKSKSKSKIGLSVQNLGGELQYKDKNDTLINSVRLGWSNESTVSHWTGNTYNTVTSLDIVKLSDSEYLEIDMGFGFKFTKIFTLRMGFSFFSGTSTGGFGLGFNIPYSKNNSLQIDYVSIDSRLYNTHRVSIRTRL
jgi:hypothetical protein